MEETQTKPASSLKRYSIRETFNMPDASPQAEIPGLEPGLPGVPAKDPHYVFEAERLRQLGPPGPLPNPAVAPVARP